MNFSVILVLIEWLQEIRDRTFIMHSGDFFLKQKKKKSQINNKTSKKKKKKKTNQQEKKKPLSYLYVSLERT